MHILRILLPALLVSTLGCRQLRATGAEPPPAGLERPAERDVPPAKQGVAYERFLVFGDWGTGKELQRKVAGRMAERAARDGLDYVLNVGDNFYPSGVESADDPQWKTKFEDVYSAASLQVPFYSALGNHDYQGRPEAQVDYTAKSERWQMPAQFFTKTRILRDGTKVQIFVLDTTPIHRPGTSERQADVRRQLRWLDRELSASKAHWKIVVGHHPLYSSSRRAPYIRLILQLEPLFVRHGVDVYFAGHDHYLEMLKSVEGVHYVVSGAAGKPGRPSGLLRTYRTRYSASGSGFCFCRISRDELVIEFVKGTGFTDYVGVIRKRPPQGSAAAPEGKPAAQPNGG